MRDRAPFCGPSSAAAIRLIRADGGSRVVTDTRTDIPSVVERTRPLAAGAPVVAAHFLGQTAAFVLGEETLLLVPREGEVRRAAAHGGAILSSTADAHRIFTAGDDGKVMATDARRRQHRDCGRCEAPLDRPRGGRPERRGRLVGRQASLCARGHGTEGAERVLELPSTVGGLAFAPKGHRLAIAHYNGVTLWFPNAQTEPEKLAWKGSHRDAIFSPDGRFVVTSMQEPTLHGWRLADRKDMRMSGYGARVRSLDWTRRRQMARDLGLDPAHPVAVSRKGRSHGQDAAHPGAGGGAGRGGRLSSEAGGGGGRLCRRPRPRGARR